MILFPNAKINIGLNILNKRKDNFHNIETIFYPIKLCDILEIIKKPRDQGSLLTNTGMTINISPEQNLIVKAYNLIKNAYKLPDINIYLHKNIPFGAGLGGGSSDAAFTIILLNKIFSLGLNHEQMIDYALQLGSDCPFFIINKPALAQGRGEILNQINLNLSGWFLTLVKPPVNISTSIAYANVKPKAPSHKLTDNIKLPPDQWPEIINNDFEKTIFLKYPELAHIKEKLYKCGAVYSSMSGSGSAVYGIFKNETNVKDIFPQYYVWSGQMY